MENWQLYDLTHRMTDVWQIPIIKINTGLQKNSNRKQKQDKDKMIIFAPKTITLNNSNNTHMNIELRNHYLSWTVVLLGSWHAMFTVPGTASLSAHCSRVRTCCLPGRGAGGVTFEGTVRPHWTAATTGAVSTALVLIHTYNTPTVSQ